MLQLAELLCDSANTECTAGHPLGGEGKSESSEEGNVRNRWEKENQSREALGKGKVKKSRR